MTKESFLKELELGISGLSAVEKSDALEYFNEYFEDSPESDEEIIKTLGDPKKAAKKIMAEAQIQSLEEMKPSPKKGFAAVGTVILAVFAIPIGLPLLIALAAVIFSLIVAAFAIEISFFATAIALIIAGIVSIAASIGIIGVHFATGIALFGAALVLLGVGALILIGAIKLNTLVVNLIIKLAKKLNRRKAA